MKNTNIKPKTTVKILQTITNNYLKIAYPYIRIDLYIHIFVDFCDTLCKNFISFEECLED